MTNAEKVVLAEQITHEIMLTLDEEIIYGTESGFSLEVMEVVIRNIRPLIRQGADNWVAKHA